MEKDVEGNHHVLTRGIIQTFAWWDWVNPQQNLPGWPLNLRHMEYEAEVLMTWPWHLAICYLDLGRKVQDVTTSVNSAIRGILKAHTLIIKRQSLWCNKLAILPNLYYSVFSIEQFHKANIHITKLRPTGQANFLLFGFSTHWQVLLLLSATPVPSLKFWVYRKHAAKH